MLLTTCPRIEMLMNQYVRASFVKKLMLPIALLMTATPPHAVLLLPCAQSAIMMLEQCTGGYGRNPPHISLKPTSRLRVLRIATLGQLSYVFVLTSLVHVVEHPMPMSFGTLIGLLATR